MPVVPLAPFMSFDPVHFRLGGSPATLHAAALRWRSFGEAALKAASSMRAINDGGFVGTEGDQFRELMNANFPNNLTTTGDAHVGVADAIDHYATALEGLKTQMRTLRQAARIHHGHVQTAVAEVHAAEAAAAGTAGAGSAAVAAAMANYHAAIAVWEADLQAAEGIKDALGGEVRTQVDAIAQQAKQRFEENPNLFKQAWDGLSDFMREHADVLSLISDALQVIGSLLMFVCPVLGAIILGIGVGLKLLLAASGGCSWGEALFDLATAGPLGLLGKAAKAGKFGPKVAKTATTMSRVGAKTLSGVKTATSKAAMQAALKSADGLKAVTTEKLAQSYFRTITRGKEICFRLEPVDMATGNMVDFKTDVFIGGILPLRVDRNANTNYELGRALGPRWVSTMDVRIEVCDDEVLMLAPDGALITFPPAPKDGSEVRADGRPWLLSYADGAYRVRDIAAGLTYTFRLFDTTPTPDTTAVGIKDCSPSLGGTYIAATVPAGSVADVFNMGIEIGVSSVTHHTGATIDYTWDLTTGHMVQMRRSDDTIITLHWDNAVGKVAHVDVSNPTTHPNDKPLRLISYEYDTYGQLIRVINSNDGALKYHYDHAGRIHAWTDRNDVSYYYRFDHHGRVQSQVGTGGMFPNIVYWGSDEGTDAPPGGTVCVALETAGEFQDDPLTLGDSVIEQYFQRLEQLPLYQALVQGGLKTAGLTGRGRIAPRDDKNWTVPQDWLYDDLLGHIRPTVYRSTPAGDVWRIITPEGRTEDTTYNNYHQKTSITDPTGAVTEFEINADGIHIGARYGDGTEFLIEPAAWGNPARVIGRDGLSTECVLDPFGMIKSVTTPTGATTTFTYDVRPSGIVPSSVTRPDGTTSSEQYDNAGRVVSATDTAGRSVNMVRDVRGLITESTDAENATTAVEYSPEGWPALVTRPDGTALSAVYDGEGNKISVTNEIGATTKTRFTVFDKPAVTTDASGSTTRIEYNTQMEPVRLINGDGNTWVYSYDRDGELVEQIDYNGITTTNAITADGLIQTSSSPAGVTTRTSNLMGQVESVTDALGTTCFVYDAVGRLIEMNGPQAKIHYAHDNFGRTVRETVTLTSGEQFTHEINRDEAGNATAELVTLPLGDTFTTFFNRDQSSEITSSNLVRRTLGSEVEETVAHIGYGVNSRGIRNRITTESLVRTLSIDSLGRITGDTLEALDSKASGGMRTLSSRLFTWRPDGALEGIADYLRGVTTYDLDVNGRVTRLSRQPSKFGTLASETIDAPVLRSDEVFEYSDAGVLQGIGTLRVGEPYYNNPQGFSASKPNRHPSVPNTSDAHGKFEIDGTMPKRVGRTAYFYDKAGRVIRTVTKRVSKKPTVHHFYYATGEQPIGFSSSDEPGVGYRYIYDPLGRRVAKECVDAETGQLLRA